MHFLKCKKKSVKAMFENKCDLDYISINSTITFKMPPVGALF